jgi:septal ring-binding cell division protein DamX
MAEQVPAASSLPEKAAAETAPSPAPGPSLTPSGKLAGAEAAAPERAETRPERREERATGRASPIDARLAAGLILLEGAGGDRLAVQLMMTDARERGYLESYLAEASRAIKPEELFLYPSGSEETPKLGVLYGTFATRREATSALEGLPAGLRRFRPYVRPLDEVRRDVRQKPVS